MRGDAMQARGGGDAGELLVEEMRTYSWWSVAKGEEEEEARAMTEVEAEREVASGRPDMAKRAAARIVRVPRMRGVGATSRREPSPPLHDRDSAKEAAGGR
jgi:hypothetical protein